MPFALTLSRRARTGLVLAVAGSLLAAGCTAPRHQSTVPTAPASAAPSPGLASFYSQQLDWSACSDLQCATLKVPLDYANPSGATIDIAVARSRASKSQGSVVVNPGGPGASGIDLISSLTSMGGALLKRSLDIVGFDPRGVGKSTAIKCVSDSELDKILAFDVDGSTPAGRAAATAMFDTLGHGCETGTGALLGHVDTISAARDMDVLRAALGEQTLTYLGFSYGTELGATYAALFPDKAGRLVLDGALDPTLTPVELAVGQAQGFENALRAFVTDCQQASDCPLTGTVDNGMAQVGALIESARTRPMATGTDRRLTASLAFTGVALPLYARDYWPALKAALKVAIAKNDGSQLLHLSDVYADRNDDGTYSSNSMEAFWAIGCADGRDSADPAAMTAEATQIQAVAPTVWKFFAYGGLVCADWPTPVTPPLPSYAAKGAPPIVVVGTTNDPATPYAWAQKLATTLSSGVLLTRKGEGHTAYLSGNSCIVNHVDEFLVNGTVPPADSHC